MCPETGMIERHVGAKKQCLETERRRERRNDYTLPGTVGLFAFAARLGRVRTTAEDRRITCPSSQLRSSVRPGGDTKKNEKEARPLFQVTARKPRNTHPSAENLCRSQRDPGRASRSFSEPAQDGRDHRRLSGRRAAVRRGRREHRTGEKRRTRALFAAATAVIHYLLRTAVCSLRALSSSVPLPFPVLL